MSTLTLRSIKHCVANFAMYTYLYNAFSRDSLRPAGVLCDPCCKPMVSGHNVVDGQDKDMEAFFSPAVGGKTASLNVTTTAIVAIYWQTAP